MAITKEEALKAKEQGTRVCVSYRAPYTRQVISRYAKILSVNSQNAIVGFEHADTNSHQGMASLMDISFVDNPIANKKPLYLLLNQDTIGELEERVGHYIDIGYEPTGGAFYDIRSGKYAQAVYLPVPRETVSGPILTMNEGSPIVKFTDPLRENSQFDDLTA